MTYKIIFESYIGENPLLLLDVDHIEFREDRLIVFFDRYENVCGAFKSDSVRGFYVVEESV